jgi:hypothetical protein
VHSQAERTPISQAWRDAQLNDPLVAIDWQDLTQLRFERAAFNVRVHGLAFSP